MVWLVQELLFPSCPFFTLFSEHLVTISVMICVTIWLVHGRIYFPILFKIMYTLVGVLLCHVSNELYYMWSNDLICCMETIVLPIEKIFKD